jgi:hypothetical protein
MKKFCENWMFKVGRDTLFGFLVLSSSLWLLGAAYPAAYNFLTQWANSPKLPELAECKIASILDKPAKDLDAYKVVIKVADQKDGIYDIIFASQDAFVSVYEEGSSKQLFQDDRNFLSKRFVSKDGHRQMDFVFDVSIDHPQQGTQKFEVGKISLDECPIEVFPLRRKK